MATNGTVNPRAVRDRLGMNQDVFWSRIFVTQSGGSRYESGRKMPPAVAVLFTIAYGPRKAGDRLIHRLRPKA